MNLLLQVGGWMRLPLRDLELERRGLQTVRSRSRMKAVHPRSGILLWTAAFCLAMTGIAQNPAGTPQTVANRHTVPPPEARADINHATADELMKVPGMTRTWAERIVRFRPYRTKQDLVERGVVTTEVYDRIRDAVIAHREKQ
jgi:DNA uptake protein ComE-like DNA-binding protein